MVARELTYAQFVSYRVSIAVVPWSSHHVDVFFTRGAWGGGRMHHAQLSAAWDHLEGKRNLSTLFKIGRAQCALDT